MGLLVDILEGIGVAPVKNVSGDLAEASRRASIEADVASLDDDWRRLDLHVRDVAPRVLGPFRTGWARAWSGWRRFEADRDLLGGLSAERASRLEGWRQVLAIWDALLHSPHAIAFEGKVVGNTQEEPLPPGARVDVGATIEHAAENLPWWAISALTLTLAGGVSYAAYSAWRAIVERDLERARRIVEAHPTSGGIGYGVQPGFAGQSPQQPLQGEFVRVYPVQQQPSSQAQPQYAQPQPPQAPTHEFRSPYLM